MKAFFLSRRMREKVLLLAFAAMALFVWASHVLGRAQVLWTDWRIARAELASQQVWLQNSATIDAKAAAATKSMDPTKTLNPTRLVGELNTLATQAGLSADIGSQHTENTNQFAFHTVQVNFRRANLTALLNFYEALSKRAPYIGLEQFSVAVDRGNPGLHNAGFRISSAELTH